jgi:hypothetical protein
VVLLELHLKVVVLDQTLELVQMVQLILAAAPVAVMQHLLEAPAVQV